MIADPRYCSLIGDYIICFVMTLNDCYSGFVLLKKEAQLVQCEVQRVEMELAHQAEIDQVTSQHAERVSRLERDLVTAIRTRDEQLLAAESNKQEVGCDD